MCLQYNNKKCGQNILFVILIRLDDRAMCETAATPLHDEGILGDAINFFLTGQFWCTESVNC